MLPLSSRFECKPHIRKEVGNSWQLSLWLDLISFLFRLSDVFPGIVGITKKGHFVVLKGPK